MRGKEELVLNCPSCYVRIRGARDNRTYRLAIIIIRILDKPCILSDYRVERI